MARHSSWGLYFTWRTLQVNREGQITERFTQAIDQLGNESLEIRLGGIYALERIARDSERDRWPIMEVLTAYVWEAAYRESAHKGDTTQLDIDIQAIMTVLRRRTSSFHQGEPESLQLLGANLKGANFKGANLKGADLSGADLSQAQLEEAIGDENTRLPADLKPPHAGA